MTTRKAYEQAVEELCIAARRKDHKALDWLAHTIGILWERVKQEAQAEHMDAFSPHQVVTLVNSHHRTHQAIRQMRNDPNTYASLFKNNVVGGLPN
jgi:hypothetical protein